MLKKISQKYLIIFTIISIGLLPFHFKFFKMPRLSLINAGSVNPDPSFTPNNLIFDNDFINTSSMSIDEIQSFLERFNSPLANTDPSFLKRFCGTPVSQCNNNKTAAQIIYEAATLTVDGQPKGVNPGVILVTLQKEQSLITKTSWNDSCPAGNNCPPGTLQYALDWAMGYSVYEDGTRIQELKGFIQQLLGVPNSYWGAPRSLRYNFEAGLGPYNTHFGDGFELSNDTSYYNVPSSQYVKPENRATLALYRYTPHVFNGNYNFWYYWNYWFGSIYNIEVSSQISFSPTTNWYYVDGNIVWIDFGIKNKNKISMKLERIKVDIWDSKGYQDIYGVSDYVLESGENFLLSNSSAFRKKIFKYAADYTAQIWIKYRGKWYLPKGAQTKNFRVIPMKWNYFYLNPNLSLNPSQIYEGQNTTAIFKIYNKTSAPLYLERLKVDMRDGTKNYDITGYSGYTLNGSFDFSQSKTINEAGTYTAGVRVKINGKWFVPLGNVDKQIKVIKK